MTRYFTKLIATLLLGVFSVFLVPKEFMHAFFEHKDTQEHPNLEGQIALNVHHTHCDFLNFEASLFTTTVKLNCPAISEQDYDYSCLQREQSGIVNSARSFLRGPPVSL